MNAEDTKPKEVTWLNQQPAQYDHNESEKAVIARQNELHAEHVESEQRKKAGTKPLTPDQIAARAGGAQTESA